MTDDSKVSLTVGDGVAELVLSNGPLNLLSMAVRAELVAHAATIGADPGVRAVVLSGSGGTAFSAGSDITEFPTTVTEGRARSQAEHFCCDAIAHVPQPVLVALSGHVLGGGLELALACDIRIAAPDAAIAVPESRLGLFPSAGGTQRLSRTVGAGRAKLMMLTGERLDGRKAYEWGLVDELADDPLAAARGLATRIAAGSKPAITAIKRLVNVGIDQGAPAGQAAEIEAVAELFAGADAREGVAAFREKRDPVFGRNSDPHETG